MGLFLTFVLFAALFVFAELVRPAPKLEDAKPSKLGDFRFPTATEGRKVPLLWGTMKVEGPNIVWYDDFRQQKIEEEVDTGLFSHKDVTVGYRYKIGIQSVFCQGGIGTKLLRHWVGDVEVFSGTVTHNTTWTVDKPNLFGGDDKGNGGYVGTLRFFEGNDTQTASAYLAPFQSQGGDTPPYRGFCYIAPDTAPIYIGNSTSIKPEAFEIQRIPNGLALSGGGAVNTLDANPMNVIYEIMTNTDWGLGFPTSSIDTTTFTAAGNTLATEGNGFSFLLDRPLEAVELIKEIQDQIDGVVFYDARTGKWKCRLARADYTIGTVPEMTVANIHEIVNFSRGSWEETTNQVRVDFADNQDDYKETAALAQDMANMKIQGGVSVVASRNYFGCKNKTLANQLAWRELRALSIPLAKATIVVDRTFWDVEPFQVLGLTTTIGSTSFVRLPMRVMKADLGELENNRITLELVQDTYRFAAGSYSDPDDTRWTPPADNLGAFPSNEQIAYEAPRAFIARDPVFPDVPDRIWCSGRRQGSEVSFLIRERHASGSPSGSFFDAGESFGFMMLGTLDANLAVGSAIPTGSPIVINPWTGNTQAEIEALFTDDPNLSQQGRNLINIILIDNEFMIVRNATNGTGSKVNLNSVYRGALDSVQASHTAGATVYLIFVGGGLTSVAFPATNNVDIKLLPTSRTDTVAEGDATTIALTMANRFRRPYGPAKLTFNGTDWTTSASLEGTGSGPETFGILLSLVRRDFRTADGNDEIAALLTDAPNLFSDYPTVNATDHQADVRNDPNGTNTFLFTDTFNTQTNTLNRIDILKATDGVLPTRLRVVVRSRHTFETVVYASRQDLTFDFNVTTALTGQFNFTALDTNDISAVYTATQAGTYNFTLSSAFTAGNVEYRLNAGAFTTLISAGNTTGSIAGVAVNDTIEVRHTSTDTNALKQLDMDAPSSGQDGYAILFV